MTFEEFISWLIKSNEAFKKYWEEGIEEDDFPTEMNLADWFEQFSLFTESQES